MRNKAILDDLLFETFAHVKNKDEMTLNTRVARGGVVCNCMSRAKLFSNPLTQYPGTIFG